MWLTHLSVRLKLCASVSMCDLGLLLLQVCPKSEVLPPKGWGGGVQYCGVGLL